MGGGGVWLCLVRGVAYLGSLLVQLAWHGLGSQSVETKGRCVLERPVSRGVCVFGGGVCELVVGGGVVDGLVESKMAV